MNTGAFLSPSLSAPSCRSCLGFNVLRLPRIFSASGLIRSYQILLIRKDSLWLSAFVISLLSEACFIPYMVCFPVHVICLVSPFALRLSLVALLFPPSTPGFYFRHMGLIVPIHIFILSFDTIAMPCYMLCYMLFSYFCSLFYILVYSINHLQHYLSYLFTRHI